jgi:uncharacterized protein YbjQ (UPF0145 family)
MIITNTSTIANHEITQTLGLVRGNTIRAKHIGKDILASLRTIIGGEIVEYTEAMQEARDQAMERMIEEAKKLDADAIVNIRYATSQVLAGAAELLVYGTAVKITPRQ